MTDTRPGKFEIRVKRLSEDARLPKRSSSDAAGADICCAESFSLAPGERRLISTGLALEIPTGYYGRVAPRSGLAVKSGIDVMAGVIDADYRGEVRILIVNLGSEAVSFEMGDRIAQLIIERAAPAEYTWAADLEETIRADGGFGSTGV
ncbi:MAG: dUTP diphosphatase [Acidobacteriota bacterium]